MTPKQQAFRAAYSYVRHCRRNYPCPRFRDGIEAIAHDCVIARDWLGAWNRSLSGISIAYVARSKRAGQITPGYYPLDILPLP